MHLYYSRCVHFWGPPPIKGYQPIFQPILLVSCTYSKNILSILLILSSTLFSSITCPVLNLPARLNKDKNPRQKLRQNLIDQAEANISKFNTVWLENSIHDVPIQKPILVAEIISQYINSGFFD